MTVMPPNRMDRNALHEEKKFLSAVKSFDLTNSI